MLNLGSVWHMSLLPVILPLARADVVEYWKNAIENAVCYVVYVVRFSVSTAELFLIDKPLLVVWRFSCYKHKYGD